MDENPDIETRSKEVGALETRTKNGERILVTVDRRRGISNRQYARVMAAEIEHLRGKGYYDARATTGRIDGSVIISYTSVGENQNA